MSLAQWAERWQLLNSKGGKAATTFWLLRQVARLDLFQLLSVELARCQPPRSLSAGCEFLPLRSLEDARRCDPALIEGLDGQAGAGVERTIARGGRVYALVDDGGGLLCQLSIDTVRTRVDTPCDLTISMRPGDSFLSFLHTAPTARRRGLAPLLLGWTQQALLADGFQRCHCHVQATNLRSLNTFAAAGWRRSGWLLASASGRYLGRSGAAALEIRPGRSGG